MGKNSEKNREDKNIEWWAGIFQDEEAVYVIISTRKDEVKKKEKYHKKISLRKRKNYQDAINCIIKIAKEKNLKIPKSFL